MNDGSLSLGENRSCSSSEKSLELHHTGEGWFDRMKARKLGSGDSAGDDKDSQDETADLQDSWGVGAVVCELPSELTEPTNKLKKKKKMGLFRRRNNSKSDENALDTSMHSSYSSRSNSSYMGPTPLGPDGKPLRSCMSASNSVSEYALDNDSDHSSSAPKMKRSVSFGEVQFREYERALGDNPSVTSGPPLSIGWRYNEAGAFSVDNYEEHKPDPRNKEELQMPQEIREKLLREQAGVTSSALQQVNREVNTVKRERKASRATVQTPALQTTAETIETVQRKLKRIVKGKSKEKEEEELWENAQRLAASASAL